MLGKASTFRCKTALLALCLGVNALAAAATLNGTATNGTTVQPSAGDEVILKSLAAGMAEIGRGKTDGRGRFKFRVAADQAPYLVSVIHQGVSYQSWAPSAATPVEVRVYDAASELDGMTATQEVVRMQTGGNLLQVIDEVAVINSSQPPRTLAKERALEIQLPAEAEVVGGKVVQAGWDPVTVKPAGAGEKGRYYFRFPLGPGETRFVVAYQLAYRGEATIEPKVLYPLQQLVIMVPETMQFEAKSRGVFQPVADRPSTYLQEMAAVKPGASLAFRISGTGQLQPPTARYHSAPGTMPPRQAAPAAPARPVRLPDHNRWWLILSGFALGLAVTAAAAAFILRRKPRTLGLHGIAPLAACLAIAVPARGADVHGAARNLTTGKPARGDEVLLLSASKPTLELARGKTGAAGEFRFDVGGIQTSFVLCVIHQEVGYCNSVPPNNAPIDVQVYDGATELSGVSLAWDLQRFQTEGDSLSVQELILVRNASNPPRTLINERPFEIQLPPEALVDSAMVRSEGGRALGARPVVSTHAGRYFFPYPLRPGETRFAVVYHLPYRGEATLQAEALYPVEQFSVVVPKSMKFEAKNKELFRPMPDHPQIYAQTTVGLKTGDRLEFRISGRGNLPKVEPEAPLGVGTAPPNGPSSVKRPGPSNLVLWFPLAGGVAVSAAAALLLYKRKRRPAVAAVVQDDA